MGISNDGKFVITGSHDKSMRLWEKTNEPLILEDERETVTKPISMILNFIESHLSCNFNLRKKNNNMKMNYLKKNNLSPVNSIEKMGLLP